MQLPKIETPKYHVIVPSTKEEIEFRPFLVKEEKTLMIAQESKDPNQIATAIQNIIKECTFNRVNMNQITMYDLEYIFIQLRCKSVGETAELALACSECGAENPHTVLLDKVEVEYPTDVIDKKYQINDDIGIVLKEPSVKDSLKIKLTNEASDLNKTIALVIDSIYDNDQVYPVNECSQKEVEAFIGAYDRRK